MVSTIRLATDNDKEQVINILNYYIETSMAAYPLSPLPYQAWDGLRSLCRDGNMWVAEIEEQGVVGFAMLKWFMGRDSFAHTAETGYFILPQFTGMGLGRSLLTALEQAATRLGITVLVANISSHNPESLAFHERMGFAECGRMPSVGKKKDRFFDVIWVFKNI
ncbi:MAG TPA: N-acetyltransferase family protein [Candidatus Cloacimonadota bacterium]|nr:N-acetyltransferase family protein [Candidatus Cloacimonadota bacterium]HPS38925.1 N-acetyltransferase family protein [Candidatus Cloacimonadota bacterium]